MPSKRVLIVDDEETLTWSMSKSLAKDKDKYEVITANNGKDALLVMRKYENDNIDLAILDIRMPGINGLDLLLLIKKRYPKTKVIIMTAYGSSDIQKEANRRGSLYYIEKPFEIKDIRKLILDAIGEKDEDRGFEGQVRGLKLADIIQMNCLGRITTALIITKDERKGTIYFKGGEIVHAKHDGVEGEEAFYEILSWRSGNFSFNNGALPDKETINNRWEFLLMEGMRRGDEQQRDKGDASGEMKVDEAFYQKQVETEDVKNIADKAPTAVPPPPPPSPPTVFPTQARTAIGFPEVAHRLRQIRGCQGSLFLSPVGEVLHSDRRQADERNEAAMMKSYQDALNALDRNLPLGEPICLMLFYEKKQKFILRHNEIYIFLYFTPDVNYEEIYPQIKRILDRL